MKITDKRAAGEVLGRDGISQRIITIAIEIAAGSYKEAIENAGRIAEIVDAASYDTYWREKATIGRHKEQSVLAGLASGEVSKALSICKVEPPLFMPPHNTKEKTIQ